MATTILDSLNLYLREPSYSPIVRDDSREQVESSLENLVSQKSKILATKLEVLAMEMQERFRLKSKNLRGLDEDKDLTREMLNKIDIAANYHLREHGEKSTFYRRLFDIETEERKEEVECWRDVVQVMRDFLYVWEAHEQAKSRAMFLDDAG